MALWEAGLVGGAALLVGGAVTALVGWTVRAATSADVGDQPFTVPWLPLTGDRRHVRRPDAGRRPRRQPARRQASAIVSARTVSGSSSLSP